MFDTIAAWNTGMSVPTDKQETTAHIASTPREGLR